MRHIKLYESWINESASSNIPSELDRALVDMQEAFDEELNNLSQYGKLGNQIRSLISDYRSQYLSSSVWNSINTKQGLESSIQDFKKLYVEVTGKSGGDWTPINDLVEKLLGEEIWDEMDKGFIEKLQNSSEILNLANTIKEGNYNLSKVTAAGIILSQLSIAITKGLYYYSASLPYKVKSEEYDRPYADTSKIKKIKNLQNAIDYEGSDSKSKDLLDSAKQHFMKWGTGTITTPLTIGTHGRTVMMSDKITTRELDMGLFKPFIDDLSLDKWIKDFQQDYSLFQHVGTLCRVYFVGNAIAYSLKRSMYRLSNFSEKGGPTWYQKIVG